MCGKNGLVERSTHANQILNDPSYILQGTLCSALLMTIEDSVVAALYHLHVSRKKEKCNHKKEQETVVKVRFVVNRTV